MRWRVRGRYTVNSAALAALLFASSCLALIVTTAAPASALTTATAVSAGGPTACAVMTGGNAYCWGDNQYGQLGNGTTTSSATPVLVSGGYTWAGISTLDNTFGNNVATTCGVTNTGVGYCWGNNTFGQVGDGTTAARTTPTLVSGGHAWSSITVGDIDTCGVTTAGAGYCWGSNWRGEDGDNSTSGHTSPTAVNGGYTWSTIDAGNSTTCGVTTLGAGYCWGANDFGQIGDTTTTDRLVPTAPSGGYTWSQISEGAGMTCGVTTAGAGYCWGHNSNGEVGDNTTTQRASPTAVNGSYTWSQISTGNTSSCGVTTSGAGYCWGLNGTGEAGDGTTTPRHAPAALSGGLTFGTISVGTDTGDDTNCGLAQDGIIYCWGSNYDSQIGDGTTNNRHVPTEASLLFAAVVNDTVSVTVDPSFTFTVANQASACNGESNFVSGAGTASTVALGHLAAAANASGGQSLTVAGNAGGGFSVYVRGTQASQQLRNAGHNWTDVTGTYGTPAVLGAGERFGYTYKDSTTSSSVTNPASAKFIALDNATTNVVMGSASSVTGSACVSYDAQTAATTPAGTYTATIVYTAIPAF